MKSVHLEWMYDGSRAWSAPLDECGTIVYLTRDYDAPDHRFYSARLEMEYPGTGIKKMYAVRDLIRNLRKTVSKLELLMECDGEAL